MGKVGWSNVLALAALAVYVGPLTRSAATPAKRLPDFFQDWGAARNYRAGMPLYGDQAATAKRHLGIDWSPETPLFRAGSTRPPAAAWLALPLGHGDLVEAFRWWNGLSLLALAALLAMLAADLPPRWRWGALLPTLAALAVWDAVGWGFREGQWSLFLAALLTAAWRCARHGQLIFSGACVGIAAAIKFFPAVLLLYFVARRERWRGAAAGLVAFAGLQLAALATFGAEPYFTYAEKVAPQLAPWRGSALNLSLPAIPHRWFAPLDRQDALYVRPLAKSPAWAEGLGTLLSAATLALWWRSLRRGGDGPAAADAGFSSGLLALLLAAPLVWEHYLVLALLPLWRWLRDGGASPWARTAVCAALWAPPAMLVHLCGGFPADGSPLVLGPWASGTLLALPTFALAWLFAASLRLPPAVGAAAAANPPA